MGQMPACVNQSVTAFEEENSDFFHCSSMLAPSLISVKQGYCECIVESRRTLA